MNYISKTRFCAVNNPNCGKKKTTVKARTIHYAVKERNYDFSSEKQHYINNLVVCITHFCWSFRSYSNSDSKIRY